MLPNDTRQEPAGRGYGSGRVRRLLASGASEHLTKCRKQTISLGEVRSNGQRPLQTPPLLRRATHAAKHAPRLALNLCPPATLVPAIVDSVAIPVPRPRMASFPIAACIGFERRSITALVTVPVQVVKT